jgi:hypothetical protein
MFDKSKLILEATDQIKPAPKRNRVKGNLGQTEINHFDVLDKDGNLIGTIISTEHTNLRGLDTYRIVEQKNIKNEKISSYKENL